MRRTTKGTFINADWLYDGTDMVGEYASGGLIRRYVHGPGINEPLVWYEGSGTGSKTWLYADHQGSIAATANSAGTSTATYAYSPYGEPNPASGIRFRYTGQFWLQEIGLYYYKARFYSPTLGRFLQTDPVGYQSDLNLYAYVGNDPVNNIDPDGNAAQFLVIPAIGGAINAIFQGYEASQPGASAYGIAAAAGKGFISGFAGTAAGLAAAGGSPALSGAIGGAVENVVNSGLNGKIPGSLPELKDAAISTGLAAAGGAAFGKGAAILSPIPNLSKDFVYKTPVSYSLALQNAQNVLTPAQIATRQVDQTISSGLGGGSVQAVGGLVGRALGKP